MELFDKFTTWEEELSHAKEYHLGYPYNMKYTCTQAQRLLGYSLNSLGGDAWTLCNYRLDSREAERAVIKYIAKLYRANDYWGTILHNGTEGNFKALHLARLRMGKNAIVYFSDQAHYSIKNSADLLSLDTCTIKSQLTGEIDYNDLAFNLSATDRPAIIIINFGTTFTGAIDDYITVRSIARDAYIHVDGALGGMIIPFIDPNLCNFNLGINSLTISGHKFIGCPLTSSILVTDLPPACEEIEYIGGAVIGGSRCGHMATFLYEQIERRKLYFPVEVDEIITTANRLYELLKKEHLNPMLLPMSNTVVFDRPSPPIVRKYQLACQGYRAHAITMQQHSFRDDFLEAFVGDCAAAAAVHAQLQMV